MGRTKQLKQQIKTSIVLDRADLQWLKVEARKTDNSMSRVIREAVRELKKQRATAAAQ